MTVEAQARIKINRLLEKAGWRFFDSPEGKANIILESNVKDAMGQDFEGIHQGFLDFLLLDEENFPLHHPRSHGARAFQSLVCGF